MPEGKPLCISLLGPPEVSLGELGARFERKKALALLCYLAVEGGRRHRAELAELLWPRSEERSARTDLRSALARLRKTLGENGSHRGDNGGEGVRLLAIEGDLLGVEPGGIELDIRTLEAAVSQARSETSNTSRGGTGDDVVRRRGSIARLERSLGVYRGEFMEGFSLEDAPEFGLWLEAERERWRALFGELCERVSSLQVGAGRLRDAIGTVRMWTRHAPLEESAHRRLVEILSAVGDDEGALLAYEGFRGALRRELGAEPSPRLAELAERLREEVEERATLGASLARSAATTPLSALEVPFAGRREEFGALVSEYHACVSGEETRICAVLGEAGIGKTRLAKEFLGWAKTQGAEVLEGAALEGAGLAYGPLVEAIRPRVERERAPEDLLEDAWLSELSRLLPELKERYPDLYSPTSGEGETAKGALFEAITRTVGALASRGPVVLFLDDLQWADAATLEVLKYAGRRWAEQGATVLLLIAARPEEPEADFPFESWLPTLRRRLSVRSLTLGPLGSEDIEGLLRQLARMDSESSGLAQGGGEEPGDPGRARSEVQRIGEWLAAETGGQPFYFVETLKALIEEGRLVVRVRLGGEKVLDIDPAFRMGRPLGAVLPQSVRKVIRSRLSHLSTVASELLVAGAVLGRSFGFETLFDVAHLEETEGLRGLDELVERRLLLEEAGGREGEGPPLYPSAAYSFSHEKIRQVAYTEAGHARRSVLHRRAFEVLKERGAPAADLARHSLAGGLAGASFMYLVAAGDEAAEVFAVRDAVAHYERAQEVSEAGPRSGGGLGPSSPDLEHLYTQMGRAYELTDEWDKARGIYEKMLALAGEAGEARLEVASLNQLAVFHFQHEGDLPRARKVLEDALKVAEEADLAEALAETECNLADVEGLWTGDFEHSWPLAEKALSSARALRRPALVARALSTLTRMKLFAGRLEEAAAHAEEGVTLNRELAERAATARTGLPSILAGSMGLSASRRAGIKALEVQCLVYLAHVRFYQGRPQEGMAIAREVRAISEGLPERVEMMSLWALGQGHQEAGEYEEALALARRGTELAHEVRNMYLLAANLGRLGEAYLALENLAKAREASEEAAERGYYGPFSHARFCVLDALSGDLEAAHAHAKRAHEVGTFLNPMFGVHLHHGIESLLRGGDEGLAREEVRRFAARAKTNGRDRMSHLRALAVLDEWEGDAGRALDRLREAEALAEKIGPSGEIWQVRARIGEIHERRGEPEEAREAYSLAAEILEGLAGRIKDEELREGFLAAPRVRRVLKRD